MRVSGPAEAVALGVLSAACLAAVVAWSPPASAQLVSTLTPGRPAFANCASGQTPVFVAGFASLKAQLGNLMGEPIECAHAETGGAGPGRPGIRAQPTTNYAT